MPIFFLRAGHHRRSHGPVLHYVAMNGVCESTYYNGPWTGTHEVTATEAVKTQFVVVGPPISIVQRPRPKLRTTDEAVGTGTTWARNSRRTRRLCVYQGYSLLFTGMFIFFFFLRAGFDDSFLVNG